MKTKLKVFACFCFLLGLAVAAEAKEWRGITPLLSTRVDVEKLLGAQRSLNKESSSYSLEDCEVHIFFAEK